MGLPWVTVFPVFPWISRGISKGLKCLWVSWKFQRLTPVPAHRTHMGFPWVYCAPMVPDGAPNGGP